MNLKKLLAGSLLSALVLAASAQTSLAALNSEQRVSDFNQLVNIMGRNYGPLRLKAKTAGLDYAKHVEGFRAKVAVAKNDTEFYQLLARFLAAFRDAHITPLVPSTYRSTLGFLTDRVQGKALIEVIDRLRLPEVLFPFKKGDQLIAIDGVPVEKIVAELSQVNNTGNDESTFRINTARLTSRRQSSGFAVPKGVSLVTILPRGASQPVTVSATWITSGSPILELDDLDNLSDDDGAVPTASNGRDFLRALRDNPIFQQSLSKAAIEDLHSIGVNDIGAAKSMFKLPEGAKEIPGLPVTAAIYEAAGKKIGLIRIPSYTEEGMLEVVARGLMVMESQTDALVIDQTNNPGGSVVQVSDMVGLFADKSYLDMMFKLRPSMNWIKKIDDINLKIAEMLKADPEDFAANALKARFEYIAQEFRDAIREKRFLTKPLNLNLTGTYGTIQPNKQVRYSKPVLILINEFDFSGGDAFPAIMKDNGRAVLFGKRTAGAGGNVAEHGPLANSYFKLQLTESLIVRPNGQYVENYGVTPDVPYEITEDDFLGDYRGYVKAFTVEALKLAGAEAAAIEEFKAK